MTIVAVVNGLTATFLLVGARVAGIVVTAPLVSSLYIPARIRVALAVVLAMVLVPGAPVVRLPTVALGLGIIVQFAVGALMGTVLAVFLALFGMAGQVVTYELGVGLAVAAEPGLLSEGSFLSEWETLLAMFVFVAGGGPELLITALEASMRAIPLTAGTIPVSAFLFVVGLFQTALMIALLVAAPLVASGMVVNLGVGVLSRAFPQLNAYFLSLPINFGVALVVFLGLLPVLFGVMPTVWHDAWRQVSHLLVMLEGGRG